MPRDETRPSRRHLMTVFAGLMLGTFVSSLNLTLVAPALPTIVAQLGGLNYYSWIPLISRHLPASALGTLQASGGVSALTSGSALDPVRLTQLPAAVQVGIRAGMADALHEVYLAALPFLALALLAALLLREIPLRRWVHTEEPAWLNEVAAAGPDAAEASTGGPGRAR